MVDLPEGLYEVDQAYLVDVHKRRLKLRDATFEIFLGKQGQKALRGRSFINNAAFVELLEDAEKVDLALSFFDDYFLWLEDPFIQVGKVFEPETESSLRFSVGRSISFLSREQFLRLTGLE
jgi:hypothetical protein